MQLVFACCQAWTWLSWPAWTWLSWPAWTGLSWPAWTWLLTGLLMHIGTDSSWVDERTEDCSSMVDERTDFNNVVGTIMINQQRRSCMIEHVVREWWNNTIGQWCYNNHELGCCVKSGFGIIPNIREQTLSIRQAVYNMLKDDWMFYHANSCYKVVEQTAL